MRRINSETECSLAVYSSIERSFGWVFFYGPTDSSVALAGNAPFIVDRKNGSIHVTGTAYPVERYLERYAAVGRTFPLAKPEYIVRLTGWKQWLLKISLTQAIRGGSGRSLAEAKSLTDELLAGKTITLTFTNGTDADRFCKSAVKRDRWCPASGFGWQPNEQEAGTTWPGCRHRLSRCRGLLPGSTPQAAHKVEMGVAAHDGHGKLPAESCNPDVVGRNGFTGSFELQPDSGIVSCRLNPDIENATTVQHSFERLFVCLAISGLGNSNGKLPSNDDRDCKLSRF